MPEQPYNSSNEAPPKHTSRRLKQDFKSEDGEGLWAVSYADLLMVMMSFFIVFFNIEETSAQKTTPLNKIALQLQTDLKAIQQDAITGEIMKTVNLYNETDEKLLEGFSQEDDSKKRKLSSVLPKDQQCEGQLTILEDGSYICQSNLENKLKFRKLVEASDNLQFSDSGIVIDFPDNIYNIGEYNLTDYSIKQIDIILKTLRPYQKKLNLVFIGHSDQVPMHPRTTVIDSNLILSSLRAAKAVEHAVLSGFDPKWVSAQGIGEYNRNTRSISLRVMLK